MEGRCFGLGEVEEEEDFWISERGMFSDKVKNEREREREGEGEGGGRGRKEGERAYF